MGYFILAAVLIIIGYIAWKDGRDWIDQLFDQQSLPYSITYEEDDDEDEGEEDEEDEDY